MQCGSILLAIICFLAYLSVYFHAFAHTSPEYQTGGSLRIYYCRKNHKLSTIQLSHSTCGILHRSPFLFADLSHPGICSTWINTSFQAFFNVLDIVLVLIIISHTHRRPRPGPTPLTPYIPRAILFRLFFMLVFHLRDCYLFASWYLPRRRLVYVQGQIYSVIMLLDI